jgi:hypothetical protein
MLAELRLTCWKSPATANLPSAFIKIRKGTFP